MHNFIWQNHCLFIGIIDSVGIEVMWFRRQCASSLSLSLLHITKYIIEFSFDTPQSQPGFSKEKAGKFGHVNSNNQARGQKR